MTADRKINKAEMYYHFAFFPVEEKHILQWISA